MSSLPPIVTPALLSSIRCHPNLPAHMWYCIAATTLSQLNRPDEIPKVYQYALQHGAGRADVAVPSRNEMLRISRRIREALVKAAAVGGVPKVIIIWLASRNGTCTHAHDKRILDNQCALGTKESDPGRSARRPQRRSVSDRPSV